MIPLSTLHFRNAALALALLEVPDPGAEVPPAERVFKTTAPEGEDGAWGLRLVQLCGWASHVERRPHVSSWPLPQNVTIPELAAFGKANRVMYEEPMEGDIFFQWATADKEFHRVGVVYDIDNKGRYSSKDLYYDLYTIEGEFTAEAKGPPKARREDRRLVPSNGDRFLRWVELGGYDPEVAHATALRAAARKRSRT